MLAVIGTPVLAALGWTCAYLLATTLPDVPDYDGTFTWAMLELVWILPAVVILAILALPAWLHPRRESSLRTARLPVLTASQALVVLWFGLGTEWWRTGGFPPTWQIIGLELIAAGVALIPSVALLWWREDGTRRGWKALAMVAPAPLVVLAIATGSAVHGVPPYTPSG